MNLQEKAISEKEAKKLGGIPLSYPCSLQSEMWIIINMIKDLDRSGVAATIRRAGFQVHDGFIYETLTARGGVMVGVHSEPRAADALAVMFAYGGGNAAIGAWAGRV